MIIPVIGQTGFGECISRLHPEISDMGLIIPGSVAAGLTQGVVGGECIRLLSFGSITAASRSRGETQIAYPSPVGELTFPLKASGDARLRSRSRALLPTQPRRPTLLERDAVVL